MKTRHPSPALVISIIALIVALTGTGYAALRISGKQIIPNSVTGKQVREKTLDTSSFTVGRSATRSTVCDPVDAGFVECVAVEVRLPRRGRVLLNGSAVGEPGGPGASGDCRLSADATTVTTRPVYAGSGGEIFAVTAVSAPLGRGQHTFRLSCNESTPSDVIFEDSQISAVMIGPA